MGQKLTIQLSDEVYEGLRRQVGAEHISQYIEDILRPLVVSQDDLILAYREMASDVVREQEALEWIEEVPDDALD